MKTKSRCKFKIILSAILAAAIAAISLAVFPLTTPVYAMAAKRPIIVLLRNQNDQYFIQIDLNATGTEAQGDGYAWDRDSRTLTLTKNFYWARFDVHQSVERSLPNSSHEPVKLVYSGNVTISYIASIMFDLTIEGTGKDGDLLTTSYIYEENGNLTIENANISFEPCDEYYESINLFYYIVDEYNLAINSSKISGLSEEDGFEMYLESSGSFSITDSDINLRGNQSFISANSGDFTISGLCDIFVEGFIEAKNGILSFNLASSGRVETTQAAETSSIYAFSEKTEPAIVLGSGVRIAEPAGGYIYKNEKDEWTLIISGEISDSVQPAQYAQNIVLINDAPVVNAVTVTPGTASLSPGGTKQFSAAVTGIYNPVQTVTWSLEGNKSSGTAISASGLLSVGADETSAALTIRATSTADLSKSGTASVTVIIKPVTSSTTKPIPAKPDPTNPDTGGKAPFLPLILFSLFGTAVFIIRKKSF